MNIIFKIGKILFQIIAAILILIALTLEHLSKNTKIQTQEKREGENYNRKNINKKQDIMMSI